MKERTYYTKTQKLKAIEMYYSSDMTMQAIIEQLGYPKTPQQFSNWLKIYREQGEEGFRGYALIYNYYYRGVLVATGTITELANKLELSPRSLKNMRSKDYINRCGSSRLEKVEV